jgi:hypothetical protein
MGAIMNTKEFEIMIETLEESKKLNEKQQTLLKDLEKWLDAEIERTKKE